MSKGPEAFRTISEVAEGLDLPQHVLRFWETRFSQIKPLKRGGGRRYYRPDDIELLSGIRQLLYNEGYTIKGVQRILKEQGTRFVIAAGKGDIEGIVMNRQRVHAGASVNADEVDADLDSPDPMNAVPRISKPKRAPASRRKGGSAARRTGESGLGEAEVELLHSALSELAECKRLLDKNH